MTDNEIIKALEYCRDYDCVSCTVEDCKDPLRFAIDLINRQRAEIERLKKENHHFADIGKMYSEVKAEAIKEFAERLKEYREIVSYDRDFDAYVYGSHIHIDIDEFENLVKEIAGEQ